MKLLNRESFYLSKRFISKENKPLSLQSAQWIDPSLDGYIPPDGSGRRVPIKNAAAYFAIDVPPEVSVSGAFEYGETSVLEHYFLPEAINEEGDIDTNNYIDWIEKTIADTREDFSFDDLSLENAQKLGEIIGDAQDYAANHLGIISPRGLETEIGRLIGTINTRRNVRQALYSFLEKAQSFKKHSRNTPYVCAFLKILSASLSYHLSPELHELDEKTQEFAEDFVGQMNSPGIRSTKDLETRLEKGSIIRISPTIRDTDNFMVADIKFRDKSKFSIFDKFLRKASDTAERIVKDGVSARIVLKENKNGEADFHSCEQWLQAMGFEPKSQHTNLTRGEGKDEERYYVKELEDGTHAEIQVTTNRGIKKSESGIFDHRVYKMKQRLLIYARLFGSFSQKVLDNSISELLAEVNADSSRVSEESLKNEIKKFFFAISNNSETRKKPRYTSYDFVSRQILTETLPERFYSSFYQALTRAEFGDIYLSDAEWEEIFDTRIFPERLHDNLEQQQKIVALLKTKKGIPKLLIRELELQSEFAEAEVKIANGDIQPEEVLAIVAHSNVNLTVLRKALNPDNSFSTLPLEIQEEAIKYLKWLVDNFPKFKLLAIPLAVTQQKFETFRGLEFDFSGARPQDEDRFRPPWYEKF